MREGHVSQTALKVAATLVTLNEKRGWRERLPEGLAEISERLILAAREPIYSSAALRVAKRRWVVSLSELAERAQPGTFEGLGERKIFMNEQVLAAIAAGARQVLVIGAGFDTLCLRLAPLNRDLQFVEIDHPATSAAKSRGVAVEGQPENMTLVAADLGATSLSEVLESCAAWNSGERSVVVAEGLLYYLPYQAVLSLFNEVATATGSGSRLAFSHLLELGRHGLARAALRLSGEPWLSAASTEDLPGYIGPGWDIIEARPARPRDLEGFAVAERSAR